MFEGGTEQPTTTEFPVAPQRPAPSWLAEARQEAKAGGRYLAFRDDDVEVIPLERGWTRIGRSMTADIRLDDPTVSRRHALIVWEGSKPVRVLDDRSLNGVLINGESLDWGRLLDGDELTIGRYHLYLIEG
jgi:pSer/pThr/pTyr-binding forkhead associated (FHA) protein